MSFASQEDLVDYYQSEEHGEIRRRVYCRLDPTVAAIYDELLPRDDTIPEDDRRAELGEVIERIMSKYEITKFLGNYKFLKKIFFFIFQSSDCLGRFFCCVCFVDRR